MTEDKSSSQAPPSVSGADICMLLFADLRGYTRFTQEQGDDAASALAVRFADLVREGVPAFKGELLELRGDEALCVFRSARQALRAAVGLQRRLRTATDEQEAFPLGVGLGLDAGEAVPTQGGNAARRLTWRAVLRVGWRRSAPTTSSAPTSGSRSGPACDRSAPCEGGERIG